MRDSIRAAVDSIKIAKDPLTIATVTTGTVARIIVGTSMRIPTGISVAITGVISTAITNTGTKVGIEVTVGEIIPTRIKTTITGTVTIPNGAVERVTSIGIIDTPRMTMIEDTVTATDTPGAVEMEI